MKKLSLLLALVLTGITFFSCMQDAPSEPTKGILTVKSPLNNDGFAVGDVINAEASAVMIDLAKIEFYIDGSLKATDDSSPYLGAIPTTGLSAGTHSVKIVAYGADGSLEQTIPVIVVTGNPPVVTITAPQDNDTLIVGSVCNIQATATDADGSINEVKFYINGNLLATDSSAPYAVSWNTSGLSVGNYTIKVSAKDNVGITGSKQINVYISNLIDKWKRKTDFGGSGRYSAIGFSVNNKGYIGIGNGESSLNDFWQYEPTTNIWTQKANFSGAARAYAVGFSIGNKGYIGTGAVGTNNFNDFWEYDPSTNVWSQKTNLGGTARYGAIGFSIGNKGYIGTGHSASGDLNDFWEYDPSTNAWSQKTNFSGTARTFAAGFAIGNKGYIGTGYDIIGYLNDFWEYDQSTNTWSQKTNISGSARLGAKGFAIGNKGYIGTGGSSSGDLNDFWEYDPSTNVWSQKTNFGGTARSNAVGFAIDNKGHIGTGLSSSGRLKDFWEYTP